VAGARGAGREELVLFVIVVMVVPLHRARIAAGVHASFLKFFLARFAIRLKTSGRLFMNFSHLLALLGRELGVFTVGPGLSGQGEGERKNKKGSHRSKLLFSEFSQ
jgi:hypothetical protein